MFFRRLSVCRLRIVTLMAMPIDWLGTLQRCAPVATVTSTVFPPVACWFLGRIVLASSVFPSHRGYWSCSLCTHVSVRRWLCWHLLLFRFVVCIGQQCCTVVSAFPVEHERLVVDCSCHHMVVRQTLMSAGQIAGVLRTELPVIRAESAGQGVPFRRYSIRAVVWL